MPDVGGIAGERLNSFIERIERLEEEKRALAEDIKEVYAEAKGTGFDTKIMRQLIRIRKRDQDELDEEETLHDVYKRALGMLPDAAPRGASRRNNADARPSPQSSPRTRGEERDPRIPGSKSGEEVGGSGAPRLLPRRDRRRKASDGGAMPRAKRVGLDLGRGQPADKARQRLACGGKSLKPSASAAHP